MDNIKLNNELIKALKFYRGKRRYLRICKGYKYFFDNNGIYQKEKDDKVIGYGNTNFYKDVCISYYEEEKCVELNGNKVVMVTILMNIGDTVEDFVEIYNKIYVGMYQEYTLIEQLTGTIERPIFERRPENYNKDTFDRIRVFLRTCTSTYTRKEAIKLLKNNIKDINEKVLEKISTNKSFMKYGIPINCLQLTSLTFTQDRRLEYIFELKEI